MSPVTEKAVINPPLSKEQFEKLTRNELTVLALFTDCLYAKKNEDLIRKCVRKDYIQYRAGIEQGQEGLIRFCKEFLWSHPFRMEFSLANIFSNPEGNMVVFHRTSRMYDEDDNLAQVRIIADIFRLDEEGKLAEHWDVVQRVFDLDYDAMDLTGKKEWIQMQDQTDGRMTK